MTTESLISIIINGTIAVGTIVVTILAIWGERIRSLLSPPKLVLEPHNNFRGDANILKNSNGDIFGRAMYFHLKVVNKRPWLPIKNCRVLLKGINRRGQDKDFHPSPLVVPAQMIWAPASFAPILVTITKEQILDLGNVWPSSLFDTA